MTKRFTGALISFLCAAPVLAAGALNNVQQDDYADFSQMTRLWCTIDYKHWAVSYANSVGYSELDFYLYLDEPHKKIYTQDKQEVEQVIFFEDKEIKFINKFHEGKKTYVENLTLDRYTGRAKGRGTIRHDMGAWASLTYENRDFSAKGQCAQMSENKKF